MGNKTYEDGYDDGYRAGLQEGRRQAAKRQATQVPGPPQTAAGDPSTGQERAIHEGAVATDIDLQG